MENDMAIQKIKLPIGTVYQKEPNGVCYLDSKSMEPEKTQQAGNFPTFCS